MVRRLKILAAKVVAKCRSLSGRQLAGTAAAVGVGLGVSRSAFAVAAYTVPAGLSPSDIADTVFSIVGPFIPVMITIGVTLMVGIVIYRLIVGKVWAFGSQA